MIEDYGSIEISEATIDDFTEIANKYLCVLINGNESLPLNLNNGSEVQQRNEKFKDDLKILREEIQNFKSELNKEDHQINEYKNQEHKKLAIDTDCSISENLKNLEKSYKILLEGHLGPITTIIVTSDNNYLISGSSDNTIRIWNFLEKKQESVLEGHTKSIQTLAITFDNKYIISGSKDKTIRI